ncbi:endoglucanase [Thermoactinomyces sp. DSM 45891]|nr:endoglucanase [Thermoactinomyces sp. DSM 45891]
MMGKSTEGKTSFKSMLKELTEAPGPPGFERAVREVMEQYATPYADEIHKDRLGSFIARKGTTGPRIMITGHMDEVGFMVTRITDDGFLRFHPLGGWWGQVLPAQRVEVITSKGRHLGVVGSVAPHLLEPAKRKKGVEVTDLFVDLGVENKEEIDQLGIRPGDFIIPYSPFTTMSNENRWLAKAMDNRLGCAVALGVLQELSEDDVLHQNQVFSVGTVMEEVGCRGAITSAQVVDPDISIVVDVGIATDSLGTTNPHGDTKMGGGPLLVLYDAGHIAHCGMIDFVKQVAEEEGIPYQFEVITGGATDNHFIHTHKTGVPSISLGVPTRYIHSHSSILDRRDCEALVRWIVAIVERLDEAKVKEIRGVFEAK